MPNASIPNPNADSLTSAIAAISADYLGLLTLNCKTGNISVLRSSEHLSALIDSLPENCSYEIAVDAYVNRFIYIEDRVRMRVLLDRGYITEQLAKTPSFIVHYRVLQGQQLGYYYLKIAKVGTAGDIDSIAFALAEDDEIGLIYSHRNINSQVGRGRRFILVIEPESAPASMARMLAEYYDVISRPNPERAMALLQEGQLDISVIMLDLTCPDNSCFDFLSRFSENVGISNIPIAVLVQENDAVTMGRCLQFGVSDILTTPLHASALQGRIRSLLRMQDTAALLNAVEFDDLTGLYTKQAFLHHARTILDANPDKDYFVFLADIENFKLVNSVYGDSVGDEVLQYLSSRIRRDIPRGILGRYSGDQFVAMLPHGRFSVCDLIPQIIPALVAEAPIPNLVVKFGIYEHVDRSLSVARICDRALSALKTVKHDFSAQFAAYDGPLSRRHEQERWMESVFSDALKNEEFVVWYQPKYSPVDFRIVGAEALVRWVTRDKTMFLPADFIPLFERDGLIVHLDEYVFRTVCAFQQQRLKAGVKTVPISVNMSRVSLNFGGAVDIYSSIAKEYGIPAALVPIELTESATLPNSRTLSLTTALKQAGFPLHMDDFGAGFSSLSSLVLFPFDVIKLDKSLVDVIGVESGKLVLDAAAELARKSGIGLIAEGVETSQQVDYLLNLGCSVVQGYHFSKPLPQEDFEKTLNQL